MSFIKQSFVLLASFVLIYFWQQLASNLTVQAIGFLVFLFLLIQARNKRKISFGLGGIWSVFILNSLIFLLIFSTGGLSSSLFFLLFFLLFGIAFILDPLMVFVFMSGALIVFLPTLQEQVTSDNLIKLFSLFLVSPLAYFFGKNFRKVEKDEVKLEEIKERSKEEADTISADVEEVLKDEDLKEKNVEKLNEVLEEADDLREESKQ